MTLGYVLYGNNNEIGGATPKEMVNLALENATTTNANDSIRITSADGSDLSASNSGTITLPGATSGTLTTFQLTANVTINLTGAHWGAGTSGDLTDAVLRVLAINDNGTLRWGVAKQGGRETVVTTDTSATATLITTPEGVLCNVAVASATNHAVEIGHFKGFFDDTGGAAEDLWAVQTGVADIITGGTADGIWQPWNPVYTGFSAAPGGGEATWTMYGNDVYVHHNRSNGTSSTTAFTMTGPIKAKNHASGGLTIFIGSYVINNGIGGISAGRIDTTVNSTTFTLYVDSAQQPWFGSGAKNATFDMRYEAEP